MQKAPGLQAPCPHRQVLGSFLSLVVSRAPPGAEVQEMRNQPPKLNGNFQDVRGHRTAETEVRAQSHCQIYLFTQNLSLVP
jgi:hypothetical protein